ncbi:MAG: DUF4249 domain-containing protein [Spirosomataceae bacterium]
MKLRIRTSFLAFVHLVFLYACVETYDVDFQMNADLVTVDGFMTDQGGDVITLSISHNKGDDSYSIPLTGCKAEIIPGTGGVIPLTEVSEGNYSPPANFRGKVGETYQLRFTTSAGKTYKSSAEKLNDVPEITKVYEAFNKKGLTDKTGTRVLGSAVDIYLDFEDPASSRNYYLWRWKLFEQQYICITCNGGRLNGLTCIQDRSPTPSTYDYPCRSACWEIFYNDNVNIVADDFFNGKAVVGRLIAQIPFYSQTGSLLEIEQVSLSKEAYDYYKLLRDQTQTTGTLTDTPPAPIIGNIQNIDDPKEKVIGYFGTAGSRRIRYWVDRTVYKEADLTPILGRQMLLEPTSPSPTYPCFQSRTRTPIRPAEWR